MSTMCLQYQIRMPLSTKIGPIEDRSVDTRCSFMQWYSSSITTRPISVSISNQFKQEIW